MRDPLADPGPLLDRLYAYVAYRMGPGAAAEDVTSAALERAVRYRGSYDPRKGTPIQWLIGIARRVMAEGEPGSAEPRDDEEPVAPAFEERALERLDLHRALARIPSGDRDLLALRYGAGLPSKAIGPLVDMKPGAVDVAVHRALARLRKAYEEPAAESEPAPVRNPRRRRYSG